MERRTFLLGGISAAGLFVLASCTPPEPIPPPDPQPTEREIPQPTAFERTNWTTDPFSLGAQSFLAVGATLLHRAVLRQPVANRIFFAGEATADERAGTVAGAWMSGLRVAEEVAGQSAGGERIAIIGAGIAGAAAARQLAAAGHDVVVLEGRDRTGGRIHTLDGGDWPFPVESGAGLVPGVAGSAIVGELAALGVSTELLEGKTEVRTDEGEVVQPPEIVETTVSAAVEWASETRSEVSLTAALAEVGADELSGSPGENGVSNAEWLQHYLETNVEDQTGASPDELAADGGWEAQQGTELIVLGNFQQLVDSALMGIDLRLSSGVSTVSYDSELAGIRFVTGESLQADRVIVTVPLGVLKSDALEFEPALPPAHLEAIAALGMGTIEKVLLRFEEPFWQSEAPIWSVVGSGSLFRQWINFEPLNGEAVLVGIAAADEAEAMSALSDDEVLAEALLSLRAFSETS